MLKQFYSSSIIILAEDVSYALTCNKVVTSNINCKWSSVVTVEAELQRLLQQQQPDTECATDERSRFLLMRIAYYKL